MTKSFIAKIKNIILEILLIIIIIFSSRVILELIVAAKINAVAIPVNKTNKLNIIFLLINGVTITVKKIIAFGLLRFKNNACL